VLQDLERLIELQRVDDELAAAEQELAGLPGRRAARAAARESAETRLAAAAEALRAAEAEQRHAETRLQDQEALHKKLEGQQFQIKTNEAYTTLLREIDHAKSAVSACETLILEAMDAIDRAGSERERAEREAEAILARTATDGGALDAREKDLGARIAELRELRQRACERVPPELLAQYDKVAAHKRPAVTPVRNAICWGCRVHVPPQLHIELLRGQRLITCPNCLRILVPEASASDAK
jgi:predicted  nucleic acid-binding Zn-ribbon protein